ncbi:MAG: adenine deaminase [Anaerolineales bacterium]|nr:adenine deaminase [Anaerolineales bacterium]
MDLIQSHLANYAELVRAARGDAPADLLLQGGRILNVLTGEILRGDLLVHKGFIVSVYPRNAAARRTIDASGTVAIPAFIDPHVHVESSMVLPPDYAAAVAAQGTGTVFADPHEIVNVMGVAGFTMMNGNTAGLPLRMFFDVSTCIPSRRGAETSGADIRAPQVRAMARLGGRKLGELMSYDDIVRLDPVMTAIVRAGWELGLPRDSHFPMIDLLGGVFTALGPLQKAGVFGGMIAASLTGIRALNAIPFHIIVREFRKSGYRDLDAYLTALGPTADHETYGPEMQVKLDHGMHQIISSHIFMFGPMTPLLLAGVRRQKYKEMIGMCTDDIWPDDLTAKGGMAGVIRDLARNGIDPIDAIRFATVNNARRLAAAGIPEAALIGALSPGMAADIVLVEGPLARMKIRTVLHDGAVVAEHGKLVSPVPKARIPARALNTVRVPPIRAGMFRIRAPKPDVSGARARILAMPRPPALPFADLIEEMVPVKSGYLDPVGYITIAVFNRYQKAPAPPMLGLIKGYTLKEGAVASTLAHDSHNLIVLGTNPEDMALAAAKVVETKGGMAAARGGKILANLAFPVGGIMTNRPLPEIAAGAMEFRKAIGSLGLDPSSPILPFAVFSLPAGPGAKVTDRGIWDGENGRLVGLLV